MDVYWLEQTEADLPAENDWLSASERLRLDGMRFAKRHADWRLGRWTAKRALAAYLNLPSHPQHLADIEIRSAPSGAPEVFIANQPAGVAISLSHRAGVAACAITLSGAELGCDLEIVEPRSDAFIADYFATEEQALIERTSAAERSLLLALLWSGKESALKALRTGLRLDTRSVTVRPVAPRCTETGAHRILLFPLQRHTGPRTGSLCRWFMRAGKSSMAGGKIPVTSCGPWSPLHLRPRRFS